MNYYTMLIKNKEKVKMEKLITYIAVDDNAPDYPRAWGQGKDHITAKLNCEIALRK